MGVSKVEGGDEAKFINHLFMKELFTQSILLFIKKMALYVCILFYNRRLRSPVPLASHIVM